MPLATKPLTKPNRSGNASGWALAAIAIIVLTAGVPLLLKSADDTNTLVVYCAHDSIFADGIIRQFEEQTGIRVDVRYDEEANKSLGLTNLLIAEKDQPRCDVFWNNQTLGTIRLMEHGILARYKGPEHARIPAAFQDADGHWAGFAARLRVFIINNDRLPPLQDEAADLAAVEALLETDNLRDVSIAVPLYGTTLSHYSILAAENGIEWLKTWHASLHERNIREARGNGSVKDLVAEGACSVGFTDTDDVFVAIREDKPVRMIPIRLPADDNGVRRTIVLPNSVALIAGARHADNGRRFIDFLLSAETELTLARSEAHQIPLGPVDETGLPEEVRELQAWARDGISLDAAARMNVRVLEWLSAERQTQ